MLCDPRMTPEDLDDDVAKVLGIANFEHARVIIRVHPNFITVKVIEKGDPEPTTMWVPAHHILNALAEFAKTYGN
jgi:hypothetical protein